MRSLSTYTIEAKGTGLWLTIWLFTSAHVNMITSTHQDAMSLYPLGIQVNWQLWSGWCWS